jgi:two-component system, chemotaxis family, protein-glutamate methylesterase/glutaminase
MAPARRVVVIGGSAGGLGALRRVVADLPPELPAAVLAVLHMPPTAGTRLAQILDRSGPLPTSTPMEGDELEEGHIYVPPTDCHLLVGRGQAHLGRGPRESGHRPALDTLFRSAARNYGPAATGVVLCGTLDDGSAGLLAIRRHGGAAVVVSPGDCDFRDMPANAVAAADPDHVVPLDALGRLLADVAQRPAPAPRWLSAPGPPSGCSCPDRHGVLWEEDEVAEGGRGA